MSDREDPRMKDPAIELRVRVVSAIIDRGINLLPVTGQLWREILLQSPDLTRTISSHRSSTQDKKLGRLSGG